MEHAHDNRPGLKPEQYEELILFLVTWSGLTPQQAAERLRGELHPGQVSRCRHPLVQRRIYPPRGRDQTRSV